MVEIASDVLMVLRSWKTTWAPFWWSPQEAQSQSPWHHQCKSGKGANRCKSLTCIVSIDQFHASKTLLTFSSSLQVFQAIHSSTCLPDASLKPATIGPRAKRAHSAESQVVSFMKARSVVMEVISRENLIFNLPVLSCLDQSFAMSWYFMHHQPNPSLQHPSAICFPNAAPPATFPSEKLSQIRQLSLQLLQEVEASLPSTRVHYVHWFISSWPLFACA